MVAASTYYSTHGDVSHNVLIYSNVLSHVSRSLVHTHSTTTRRERTLIYVNDNLKSFLKLRLFNYHKIM